MPRPAENLQEAVNALQLVPLDADSRFYVNLSAARGSKALARLERHYRDIATTSGPYSHTAFIGHRGSGKTTELRHLEEDLKNPYYPIHLELDEAFQRDGDYPELLLTLVEQIVEALAADEVALDRKHVEAVADWFWVATKIKEEKTEATLAVEAEAEAGAKFRFFGVGARLLTRLRSAFKGSTERRSELRRELKADPEQLLARVNLFLGEVRHALAAAGRPARLLIVQDQLDRLSSGAALSLFRDNASILKSLEVDCIWTAPVGTQLHPYNISRNFLSFQMPTISVRNREGVEQPTAIAGLTQVVATRLNIDLTFESPDVVQTLVLASGGSIRELLRLIESARLTAVVEDHLRIEASDATAAIKEFSIALQDNLTPSNVYFPILAEIAVTKQWQAADPATLTIEADRARMEYFHRLIVEGVVLEYNGDERWHDVNPILRTFPRFMQACAEWEEAHRQPRKPRAKATRKK